MVLFCQLHRDIGIGSTHDTGARVREIQARIRDANVVDDTDQFAFGNLLADGVIDQIAEPRGFLDPGAGRGAQVNLE